jgi:hypothetical protein
MTVPETFVPIPTARPYVAWFGVTDAEDETKFMLAQRLVEELRENAWTLRPGTWRGPSRRATGPGCGGTSRARPTPAWSLCPCGRWTCRHRVRGPGTSPVRTRSPCREALRQVGPDETS